jgi:hypothetical protein
MADKQDVSGEAAEQAHARGYLGETYDEIENEAYTVTGQGPETAQREREQRDKLRKKWQDASVEGGGEGEQSAKPAAAKKSSSSSSSSSPSSSS